MADDLRSIFYASSRPKAEAFYKEFHEKWNGIVPSAVKSLENSLDSCLTFFSFPEEEWISLRTTNVIERLNKEFKRRTKPEIMSDSQTGSKLGFSAHPYFIMPHYSGEKPSFLRIRCEAIPRKSASRRGFHNGTRHSLGTQFGNAEVPIHDIQKIFGHVDMKTTNKAPPPRLRQADSGDTEWERKRNHYRGRAALRT